MTPVEAQILAQWPGIAAAVIIAIIIGRGLMIVWREIKVVWNESLDRFDKRDDKFLIALDKLQASYVDMLDEQNNRQAKNQIEMVKSLATLADKVNMLRDLLTKIYGDDSKKIVSVSDGNKA